MRAESVNKGGAKWAGVSRKGHAGQQMLKPGRNDPCWCGSLRKYKTCHAAFDDRLSILAANGHVVPSRNMIKWPEKIERLKESAKINITVCD